MKPKYKLGMLVQTAEKIGIIESIILTSEGVFYGITLSDIRIPEKDILKSFKEIGKAKKKKKEA